MLSLYMKLSIRLKHVKILAEIFVIPRNMSFAVLRSSLIIHIRFSDDIYKAEHRYRYSIDNANVRARPDVTFWASFLRYNVKYENTLTCKRISWDSGGMMF